MVVKRPWRDGLRWVPGSSRLVVLRWLLFIVAALPGLAAGMGGIGKTLANRPYFTEAPDPLPLLPLMRMLGGLPGSVWGMLALAAVVAWLGNLLLTAGAVAIFGAPGGGKPRVWQTVFRAGSHFLWAYLRIALIALVLLLVGMRLIGAIGDRLQEHAAHSLWTLHGQFLLQAAKGLATVCWFTLVGLFAWWGRVIVVADERYRVRRLLTVVPRLWKRRPLSALLLHFLLALAGLLAGSAVLVAWRQSPAGGLGWALAWLLVLAVLSCLWHWRLRAGRLLWSSPDLVDLRALPDTPWSLPSRLLGRLRRRRGAPASPAPTDPTPAPGHSVPGA